MADFQGTLHITLVVDSADEQQMREAINERLRSLPFAIASEIATSTDVVNREQLSKLLSNAIASASLKKNWDYGFGLAEAKRILLEEME